MPDQPTSTTANAAQQEVQGPKAPHTTIDNTALVETIRGSFSVGSGTPRTNDLLDSTIIAKPLGMGEGFFTLRPKNPNVVFRAIACNVNPGHCDNPYLRYEQAKIQGYVNAVPSDVQGDVSPGFVKDNGARIVNGDLILMKISKSQYRGALKWKDQQALRATKKAGVEEDGNRQILRAMQETNIPSRLGRKLQPFTPGEGELRKDFGG